MRPHAETLHELLAKRGESHKEWLIFPEDPVAGDKAARVSFAEVYDLSLKVAAGLRTYGAERGDRIAVIADNDIQFVSTFLGAVLADLIPVPLHAPFFNPRWTEYVARVGCLLKDAAPRLLVASDDFSGICSVTEPSLPCASMAYSELLSVSAGMTPPKPTARATDVALVQYSSGSTRTPLGAMLTHSNVLHNVHAVGTVLDGIGSDVILCWLPLFHDMGLIGLFLYSLYWNMSLVLMSPKQVVLRPAAWLWAVSRFRCVGCAAPNFGYALCTSPTRVPDNILNGLDLSTWRAALNGAELVQESTIRTFAKRFGAHGFRAESMMPVYGLAENTVAACFPPFGREPRADRIDRRALERRRVAVPSTEGPTTRSVFSVGHALPGQEVRVVDDDGDPVAERTVGHVQIRGACVMRGYLNHPAHTARTIDVAGWLKTGDLGYFLDGELYVVGRAKEVVKKAGVQYDAADIRAIVGAVPGVRNGAVAAFSVPNESTGTEDFVIVTEVTTTNRDRLATIEAALQREIQRTLAIRADVVRMVTPGTVPKSTSGKVRVLECRRLYLENLLVSPATSET